MPLQIPIGFFLPDYAAHFKTHLQRLASMVADGSLAVKLDPKPFVGLAQVPAAVEHLQSGNSRGKARI